MESATWEDPMIGHDDQQAAVRFRLLDQAPSADRWLEESDETFDEVTTTPVQSAEQPVAAHVAAAPEAARPTSLDAALTVERTPDREIARLRDAAAERIAAAERMELEALTRRRAAEDRQSEAWAAEQQRRFTERLEAMLDEEAAEIDGRRRTAGERVAAWAAAERERIEVELVAEEQHFHDRLLRQLEEFEFQLGERLREQEERLGRWIAEAERIASTRTGSRRSEERRELA
jgi:hypothetical protein